MAEQELTSDDKLWAGLSYAGTPLLLIPPIVIFALKKDESEHIKFHALQALALGVSWLVVNTVIVIVSIILGMIPFVGWIAGVIIGLASAVVGLAYLAYWIVLMIWAFTGKEFRIPVLGNFVEQQFMK